MARVFALVALLLSIGTLVAFVGLLYALIPLDPVWYLGALAVAVGLAAAAIWQARHWLTIASFAATLLLLVTATLFNFVAMKVPASPPAFVIGRPAPDFTLPDAAGHPVRLADYRGRKPIVLVFYRGYW